MKEKASFSSLLLFLGFLISAAIGFFIGSSVSDLPKLEGRLNLWWKYTTIGFALASFYVNEFLVPGKSLPINNLTNFPRSRLEFLRQIAVTKQALLTVTLMVPALAISIIIGNIPVIWASSCFPGMFIVALAICTWGTAIDLSPSLLRSAWKRNFIYPAIVFSFFILFLIFTLTIPKVGNLIWNTRMGYSIFLTLFSTSAFIVILEDSYRSLKQNWTMGENHGEKEAG